MMKPHKHAELIKAWADGAEIEIRVKPKMVKDDYDNSWVQDDNPDWSEDDFEYRIKIPQWRQDMANAIRSGKVVEYDWGAKGGWMKTHVPADEFEDMNVEVHQHQYRIKPEPKPDEVHFYQALFDDLDAHRVNVDHANLKLTFDGETGELKSAEVLK